MKTGCRRGSRPARTCVILVAVTCFALSVAAQTVAAPELTAAFLFNFAKFTEWPADVVPAGVPLMLCVVNDPRVGQALSHATRGQVIDGHPLVVATMKADGPVRTCQLLYAGGLDARQSVQLLDVLKGVAVLTVSDLETFANIGGTANLYVEGGRMRIAVNVESAQRFRVRLSSQLLSLAKLVKDDPNAVRR
jgi:hypothetical protein